ncbi:MAG: DNA polymerase III subunit alpha, partial [Treponema sp.]|nr:DNA polymerase III subunit alpha [Treponema sp.]
VLAYRTGWLKANKPAEFMAANLTNEITSTDGLPAYIAEARRIGVPVDPPDVNRSDAIFDVVDGHIVFGFKGIKGMGDGAARTIVKEREANGPYKDFMDFLIRVIGAKEEFTPEEKAEGKIAGRSPINKKAVEVLIKCGGFDNLGKNRPTLISNLDRAYAYAEKIALGSDDGQLSLFGDTDEKEYTDYVFEEVEDCSRLEKLNMEKDLIGCYVSGHPLDDYKKAYDKATVNSLTIARAAKEDKALKDAMLAANGGNAWKAKNAGKVHTAVGMVTELRTIRTKHGEGPEMAFAKLQDYNGSLDLTFFPKTWEVLKGKVQNETIYAFKGKVDSSREQPSLLVDSIEDPNVLQEKAIEEVHIQLESGFNDEKQIFNLKEYLFGASGACSVYFHIDTGTDTFIVKASNQLTAPATKEFAEDLKAIPFVKDVWFI